MSNYYLKTLALLICAVLLFSFTSCKPNEVIIGGDDIPVEKLEIVKNGSTEYKIVIPFESNACIDFTASEMYNFIYEATSIEIATITDQDVEYDITKKYISIDNTALLKNAGIVLNEKDLNVDGFVIKYIGNIIFIAGANDRATLYGVYDFLEKFVGVKFIAYDCTYIPKIENIFFPKKDIVEVPAFEMRNYFSAQIYYEPLFETRSRISSEFSRGYGDYGYPGSEWYDSKMHNTTELVDPTIYYDSHPDWFYRRPEYSYYIYELCFSNGLDENGDLDTSMEESVLKVFTESLKERIISKPSSKYFMIGQQDYVDLYCSCDECLSNVQKYGGRSGLLVVFMNAVAKEIEAWRKINIPEREVNIVTFAYLYTEKPPVVKNEKGEYIPVSEKAIPADNLYMRLATLVSGYYPFQEDVNKADIREVFDGWSAITNRIMTWDYNCNYREYLTYFSNFRSMKDNLLYYKKIGVKYVMNQSSYDSKNDWQALLKTYIGAKLLWNPNQNMDDLLNEFLLYYFGSEPAKYIREYIDLMEQHFQWLSADSKYLFCEVTGNLDISRYYLDYYPKQIIYKSLNLINLALNYVKNSQNLSSLEKETYIRRITRVLLTPQRTAMNNYSAYYDILTFEDFAQDFFINCDIADFVIYQEGKDIKSLKQSLGMN